jgi:hypothetical protein
MFKVAMKATLFLLAAAAYINASAADPDAASSAYPPIQNRESSWSGWGGNNYNDRWASSGSNVNSAHAVALTQKCNIEYPGGVSATPIVVDDVVYYPTWVVCSWP